MNSAVPESANGASVGAEAERRPTSSARVPVVGVDSIYALTYWPSEALGIAGVIGIITRATDRSGVICLP